MIDTLDSWDKQLMLFMNYDGGAWADHFWFLYSYKFTWIPVYCLILLTFFLSTRPFKQNWRKFAWLVFCTVLIIVLADQISSGIIKHLVERPRPSHNAEIEDALHFVNGYRGGAYGFVSSHAANSIGLATWLILLFRRWIFHITILSWSIATCYSRIYLGVHYPGDIAGGLCVGILCALFMYYTYKKFSKTPDTAFQKKEPWLITLPLLATVIVLAVI